MTRRILDPVLLAELASVDTPTICNAIEAFNAQCRKVHEHALREYVIGKDFSLEGLRERVLGRSSH